MRNPESILRDLRRISTDNHRCFGCGQEHDCSIHGCAIIREAAALIEGLQGSLTASEEARSELGKRLAKAQQSLHETKSEFDALLADAGSILSACDICANTNSYSSSCRRPIYLSSTNYIYMNIIVLDIFIC